MKRFVCILLGLFLLVAGQSCSHKETVKTGDNLAYARFTGNLLNAVAVIDGLQEYELAQFAESKKDFRFEMSPGRHQVIVTRNGTTIVNRELLFSTGIVTEIRIP